VPRRGQKDQRRKRHIVTDTEGNLVHALIHTADIQERDGAPLLLAQNVTVSPGCVISSVTVAMPGASSRMR
jgi:hypothetical protein